MSVTFQGSTHHCDDSSFSTQRGSSRVTSPVSHVPLQDKCCGLQLAAKTCYQSLATLAKIFQFKCFFYSRNVFLHVLKELKFYIIHFNSDKIIFYKLTSSSNLLTDIDSNLTVLCFIFALFLFYISLFGTFGNSTVSFVYLKS